MTDTPLQLDLLPHVQAMLGKLMLQIAELQAVNELLQAQLRTALAPRPDNPISKV